MEKDIPISFRTKIRFVVKNVANWLYLLLVSGMVVLMVFMMQLTPSPDADPVMAFRAVLTITLFVAFLGVMGLVFFVHGNLQTSMGAYRRTWKALRPRADGSIRGPFNRKRWLSRYQAPCPRLGVREAIRQFEAQQQ